MKLYEMTRLSLFATLGAVLMVTLSIPIMPSAPFLRYNPGDVMVILASVSLGPWGGVMAAIMKNVLVFLMRGSNPIGLMMNFIATAALAVVVGYIFRFRPGLPGLLTGGSLGALLAAAVMIPANLLVVPFLHGIPYDVVLSMILPVYIPFNLLKGAISTGLAIPLFLALRPMLLKGRVGRPLTPPGPSPRSSAGHRI
ncbi:MAG: ECF transporter S component [Thermaerobacterales bacterium]